MISRGWYWALGAIHCASAVLPHPVARTIHRVTKPLLMPALAASSPAASSRTRVALAASTIGDTALMSDSAPGVLGGIGGFGVAHLAYLRDLLTLGRTSSRTASAAVAAGAGIVTITAASILGRALGSRHHLTWPVLGYATMVTSMGAAATRAAIVTKGSRGRQLAIGGTLFMVSDSLVAAALFGPARWDDRGQLTLCVMATYLAAQAALVNGLSGQVPVHPSHDRGQNDPSRSVAGLCPKC